MRAQLVPVQLLQSLHARATCISETGFAITLQVLINIAISRFVPELQMFEIPDFGTAHNPRDFQISRRKSSEGQNSLVKVKR
jgi:hypothetical protein